MQIRAGISIRLPFPYKKWPLQRNHILRRTLVNSDGGFIYQNKTKRVPVSATATSPTAYLFKAEKLDLIDAAHDMEGFEQPFFIAAYERLAASIGIICEAFYFSIAIIQA
jgi:hypothetical protein